MYFLKNVLNAYLMASDINCGRHVVLIQGTFNQIDSFVNNMTSRWTPPTDLRFENIIFKKFVVAEVIM